MGRGGTGAAWAALPFVGALAALPWSLPIALGLMGATGLVLLGTAAPKLPLFHHLPHPLGAPMLDAAVHAVHSDADVLMGFGETLVRVEVTTPVRLEDAGVRFFVPDEIELSLASKSGTTIVMGEVVSPEEGFSDERFWTGRVTLHSGLTPFYFQLRLPNDEPRSINVRLEVDSEKLYDTFVAHFEAKHR